MSGRAASEHVQQALSVLTKRLHGLVAEGIDSDGSPMFAEEDLADTPLGRLVHEFGLDEVDAGLIVAAAAPELDARIGEVLGGLDGPRGRTHVRVDVALAVAGGSAWSPLDRARLSPAAPLRAARLLEVVGDDLPFPERVLRLPERVVQHLLGFDALDPEVAAAQVAAVHADTPVAVEIARALQAGSWAVWVRDTEQTGRAAAVTALAALGVPAVTVDTRRLPATVSVAELVVRAVRDARLAGGGVVIGPLDPRADADALRLIAALPSTPIVMLSSEPWDPTAVKLVPVQLDALPISLAERRELWTGALELVEVDDAGAIDELAALRLPPEQLPAVVATARSRAIADGSAVETRHLRRAALAIGASRLDAQAQRVAPRATFDDLVLPADLLDELRLLPGRYRTRDVVRDQWQIGHRTGGGRGITCLFAGPSGTGKTLAAEAVAHALGVELFVIDLSQIVDKYIGETEKNLERVFSEAEGVNGVLLFDEADALFGKRTDVRSSHDRHANVEVAYLLQRMERYDGVAVLTTNLRGNIDEAFTRRLDVVCAFVEPGLPERLALWERHLPPALPQSDDVDVAALAAHFAVSGGIIRNVAVTAAHAAAASGSPVSQRMLVEATRREYTKIGRLFPDGAAALLQ
jgi:hypothetical protein